MLNPQNRTFFLNAEGVFEKNSLLKLREEFVRTEADKNMLSQGLSEREKQAILRGESSDAMRLQEKWYSIWGEEKNRKKYLDSFFPFTYVIFPVQVRHMTRSDHKVPWHQDISYMRLLKDRGHQQVVTCFVPIDPEPYKCSTIQFADDDSASIELEHKNMDGFGAGIDGDGLKGLKFFDQQLGDALVFGDHTIHRTFTPEGRDVERRSLEYRLIIPEHRLPNKDYFDIKLGKFIKTDENRNVING